MSDEIAFKFIDNVQLLIEDNWRRFFNNLVPNPDGAGGAWGWVTPDSNAEIYGDQPGILFAPIDDSTGSGSTSGSSLGTFNGTLYTADMPILPGYEAIGYRITGHSTNAFYWTIRFVWINSAGAIIGTSAEGSRHAPGAAASYSAAMLVPTNLGQPVAAVRIQIQGYASTSAALGALAGNVSFNLTKAVVAQAHTPAALTDSYLSTVLNPSYTNILGETNTIKTVREGLNLGTLSAVTIGADLDPSVSDQIQPGRRVKVMVNNAGTWEPIFTGTLTHAKVTYDLTSDQDRTRIEIAAVDAVSALSATPASKATVETTLLPLYALWNAGVPWDLEDIGTGLWGTQGLSYPYMAVTSSPSSAVSMVALMRDEFLGYAWVSKAGVVKWRRNPSLPYGGDPANGYPGEFASTVELTEADYSPDLGLDYDTDRCVNTVNVTVISSALSTDDTGGFNDTLAAATQQTIGPFVNAASRQANGEHATTITIPNYSLGTPANLPQASSVIDPSQTWEYLVARDTAAILLAQNANPARRVLSASIPIRTTDDLAKHATRELYDLAHITNDKASIDQTSRVESITHTITATKNGGTWTQDLEFLAVDAIPAPTAQSAALSGAPVGDEGWKPLPYAAGWADYTPAGWQSGRYKREGQWLYINGMITGPAIGAGVYTTMATLPEGYRPGASIAAGYIMGANMLMGRILVAPSGVVQVVYVGAQANGGLHEVNVQLPLD